MSKNETISTFQTRLEIDEKTDEILTQCAALLSRAQRILYAKTEAGINALSCKKDFIKEFAMTARHFNAIRVSLEGKMESFRKLRALHIKTLDEKIAKLEEVISKLQKRKHQQKLHRKKIRLDRLQAKRARLKNDHEENRTRLCFGSKKLFRSQFLSESSHEEWKQRWSFARNHEFFSLGSKDETGGNQTCTAFINKDGSLSLRLRLPDSLNKGKYLHFHNVRFAYGQDVLLASLQSCQIRAELLKEKNPAYREHGRAISYRFSKDKKGWRIFASTSLPQPTWVTDQALGAIGIDINADHLAMSETDRSGNLNHSESIPLNLYGKSRKQALAAIGDACKYIVEKAQREQKPIVIERLDFANKRSSLKERSAATARKLSSFCYSMIIQTLRSRAYRCGVQVLDVNPAYTSVIGAVKYAKQYGITTHQAAAFCIARRFYQYSEKLPLTSSIPDGKGGHILFSVPVRNRKRNEWSYLAEVSKKLRAAHAGHFRVAKRRSGDPPKVDLCEGNSSKFTGETPVCESLATLFG
jgi:IS605 OrfB family transposase